MTLVDHLTTILNFVLHVTLVTVCMKRRRHDILPLPALIGPWLMALVSTLSLTRLMVGEDRFNLAIRYLLPETWFGGEADLLSVSAMLSYNTVSGFIALVGLLLLSIGIFMLARQRTQEAIAAQQPYAEGP